MKLVWIDFGLGEIGFSIIHEDLMTGADISITREHREGVMINDDDDEVGSMVKEGEKITFLNILGEQWDDDGH